MNKLMRRFYSLCTADAPPPFLRGGGACTQARFLLVKRIKMIRKPLNVSHLRLSPKASNKKHTGIIKTLVGLHSHSTFISLCFKPDRLLQRKNGHAAELIRQLLRCHNVRWKHCVQCFVKFKVMSLFLLKSFMMNSS